MINKVTLLGRIGRKEYKATKNQSFMCNLSVATHERYLDYKGNTTHVTTWHNVKFFNKLADIANEYIKIGELVYIEGKISNRVIEENGVKRQFHSVIGNHIQFLPTGNKDHADKSEETHSMENHAMQELCNIDTDESIPF